MRHNPQDPDWPDRDRFVLSAPATARCCSTASCTSRATPSRSTSSSASGQWGSLTPGHPERDRVHVTPGVEVTTGPLGQGFANGVGMAMAERFLREKFGERGHGPPRLRDLSPTATSWRASPREAASLAGQARPRPPRLPLRRQLDLARRADVAELRQRGRHQALRGLRLARHGGPRRQRPRPRSTRRSSVAKREEDKPDAHPRQDDHRLPVARTSRGRARRTAPRSARTRSAPTKEAMGWDPDAHFLVPDGVYEQFSAVERGRRAAGRVGGAPGDLARGGSPSAPTAWDAA